VRLTGLAVIRAEIVDELASDQRLFRFIALGIGLIICWIFFGRLSLVAVAGIPAAIAVIWLLGGMWLADQKITLLTGVAPTIVLVIVFSDCVHLLFSIRAAVARGETLDTAIDKAVRQVGPACVLTSLTTTLALASLIFVPHPFISRFGLTAAAGTAVALIVTLTTVPALSVFLLRGYARQEGGRSERNLAFLAVDAICRAAGAAVLTAPRTIAALGLLITLAGGWLHSMNEPRYSYASNLPQGNPALAAIEAVNAKLAGANTLMVVIDWPDDYEFFSLNTLEAVRNVHAILAEEKALGAISSLHAIEEWLGGDEDKELRLVEFLEQAQEQQLVTKLVAPEQKSALVTAQFKNLDSAELVPILDRIEQHLNVLRQEHPKAAFDITGIVPISADASYEMLQQLNRSLLIAVGLILILLTLAMHSLEVGLVSILPNLFPLSVGGAYLFLFEGGLQFTGLVAFTVGFGIAVDSTIHMLNRYRLERAEGLAAKAAVQRMIALVGPVIIVSTLVLAAGIGTSILSELPMVRLYGSVVVIVLGAALVGDLLFLPAVMAVVERWRVIDWGRRSVSRRLKARERS
jgi:predicted RND superfamily exporter protein